MDTRTGEVFRLDERGELIPPPTPAQVDAGVHVAHLNADLAAAQARLENARAAGRLVEVSESVATAQRLGQRELDRRRKRRKASRAGRKANRG